ncbi:Cyclic pyranopterin monophosphate synthase, mitochondrial [Boothiomyces sp. JEL0866]|nr:Cyclic pyranopterin monophosphate synthase, mitochondrial [Boothiomyces sp. JEL0866]
MSEVTARLPDTKEKKKLPKLSINTQAVPEKDTPKTPMTPQSPSYKYSSNTQQPKGIRQLTSSRYSRGIRFASSLSHVNESGNASMVDISEKPTTNRTAHAQGKVMLGKDAFYAVKDNQVKKGDVLTVAQIAGIQAAKQTSNLIPLCHQVNLSKVQVKFTLNESDYSVLVESRAVCDGKTGVEMEAIIAVSVAACTIYDMCKAINKGIEITEIFLLSKYGGKGAYER